MNEDDSPTILNIAAIDRVMKDMEDNIKKCTYLTQCTSCNENLPVILTHERTGQCQQCFHDRKPWCQSSPVIDAYFKLTDGR